MSQKAAAQPPSASLIACAMSAVFPGGYSSANEYVCEKELSGQEMFLPLAHPPGDAEADFGEALVLINGVEPQGTPLGHRSAAQR